MVAIVHPKAAGSLYNSNYRYTGSINSDTGHKVPTLSKTPMQDHLRLELRHLQMKGRSWTVFETFITVGNGLDGVYLDVQK
jgi:hypothetical protein